VTAPALDAAARMGERAAESFVRTGIWPRNPFSIASVENPRVADVARAFDRALFARLAAARKPK
jgi:hypothetical protein